MRRLTASLAAFAILFLSSGPLAAQPVDTEFGDHFDDYTAGANAGGFLLGKNGSVNTHAWTISGSGANKQYRAAIANQSYAGGGFSYAVRGVPYVGGLHRKDFTLSSTFKVVSGSTGYTIGLLAMAPPHYFNPANGPYYWFGLSQDGTIKIRTSWDSTSGLTVGSATNLSGGIVIGTTYTFTVEGTYTGDSLALNFTITGGGNTASVSATDSTAVTGLNFGYLCRLGPAGSALTLDMDNFNVDVPMTFTQVWEDQFTGTSLDTSVWSKGYRWSDVINNELQAMRPENVVIANGLCTIDVTNPASPAQNRDMWGYQWGNFDYASGAIQTYNKLTVEYGYIEARIKMPTGMGTWPAFWLLPDRGQAVQDEAGLTRRVEVGDNGYGRGSEIDITEYMAAWKDPGTGLSRSHSGLIWSYASGGGTASADYALTADGFGDELYYNADGEFHTYGVYWEPGVVTFYLDGKVVLTRQQATYVPNVPHYILLNVAITQNDWHGNTIPLATIDAGMPSVMEVDYVRVYDVTSGAAAGGSREPVADAYVRDGSYQYTNYGTATTLEVKDNTASYNREIYLKFDATGLGSTSSVQLQLLPVFVSADSTNLRFDLVSDDSWSETGIKWSNKPGSASVIGTVNGPFTVGQPVVVDVTSAAQGAANGDGVLSIRVLSTVNGSLRNVNFGSKEDSTASNRPALVY